jgi:L-ascorbate metabolism protein UlaG (beta-lactamase superfamily)
MSDGCKLGVTLVALLILSAGCEGIGPAAPSPVVPDNQPPVISGIADQTVVEGERFARLFLTDHVSDADNPDDEIAWRYSGNVDLEISEVSQGVVVRVPDEDWSGSEIIRFEACDPAGLCDATRVVFTVIPENDAPVVSDDIVDRLIVVGEVFAPIALDGCVEDVDNPVDEIEWRCSGNVDLEVDIIDRVATVMVPDAAWTGSEAIQFRACDPDGLCDVTDVVFTVTDEPSVLITYVFNAGFLISSGGKKILVDALFDHCRYGPCSPSRIGLMENGLPPFDGVDLILTTHIHYDHFDALIVGRHLESNPQALFVSTEDTVNALQSKFPGFDGVKERVVAVRLERGESMQTTLNGIELEIITLPHTDPNLGFIMNLEGGKVAHLGDAEGVMSDFLPYRLPEKDIDVVIATHYQLMGNTSTIVEGVQARHIVPMHFPPGDVGDLFGVMEDYFPQVILFREPMDSWVLPD